ncbi:MAG: NHL repeat-containing protein [Candidatus Omnitrophica bacterium]|nr:NHL repeat-containing protein [Candidatus Omnitrophota bacterium]
MERNRLVMQTLYLLIFILSVKACITAEKKVLIFLREEKIKYNENDENYIFYNPSSLKVDMMGNVYVVDSNNHRIQVFTKEGNFLRTIGRKGEGPSELFNPTDIFVKEDTLYISDTGNMRIQVADLKGKFRKIIKLNFRPMYILVNKKEEIYVHKLVDVFNPSREFLIKIISKNGEKISEFHEAIKTPERVTNELLNFVSITMDSKENIIVAHKFLINRVVKYNNQGKYLSEFKTLLKAAGPFMKVSSYDLIGFTQWITCGVRDRIYLLSYKFEKNKKDFLMGNEIYQFDSSGMYEATLVLPFNAKIFVLGKDHNIFAIDEEDRLRKCLIPKNGLKVYSY